MKQSSVGAFARGAQCLALAAVVLFASASALHAQATGKLEGRIRDQAGAPVAGAQVRIEGTAFGAVADARGYYFINNVPASTVDLIGQFVGYKPVRVTGLKILAGQTITQDFSLEQTAVELGEIEVTAAQNVLVPRDEVTTKQRIDGAFTRNLPVDQLGGVLALQPGVVVNNNGFLTIRGGRTDEAATYIDGVPVNSGNRGTVSLSRVGGSAITVSTVSVAKSGFEEASVTTGGSSAEFGNAQSGIVNIQTRTGGSRFAGSVAYESDAPFGANHGIGLNRTEVAVSGPISGGLTFAVSGALQGIAGFDRGFDALKNPEFVMAGVDSTFTVLNGDGDSVSYVFPRFAISSGDCDLFSGSGAAGAGGANPADAGSAKAVKAIRSNYGLSCSGVRGTYTPRSQYQVQGKLSYSYGTGSHISVTALRTQDQRRTQRAWGSLPQVGFTNVLSPHTSEAQQLRNQAYILNLTQNLAKTSDKALAVDLYFSYQRDKSARGNLTAENELDTRSGLQLKGYDFLWDFDNIKIDNKLIKAFRANDPSAFPLDNTAQYDDINTALRTDPYGVLPNMQLLDGGPSNALDYYNDRASAAHRYIRLYDEQRYIGKGNLDWQLDRYNRLKLGGEFTRYTMRQYIAVPEGGQPTCFCDAYFQKPIQYNGYIENRLDLGDVVVVGGLRYDYYDSKASHPYFTSPDSTYQMPAFTPPSVYLRRDKSHDYLSPHVQVSFPVTDRTNFRLSYAHQVQAPDFSLVYAGINTAAGVATNTNTLYGSDLDFGKTITFEFGIRHSFNDDMVLDVAAFNKDKLSDVTARIERLFTPNTSDPTGTSGRFEEYRLYENRDFGTIRGLDVRLDRRFGNWFNGTLSYTFQDAKDTGTDPASYVSFFSQFINPFGGNAPAPQAVLTTDDSRPHTIAGSAALTFPSDWQSGSAVGTVFRNVGLFATFRYASGTPYTACPLDPGNPKLNQSIVNGELCDRGDPGGRDVNGARLPASKLFDLRVTKGIALGGLSLTAYADIRNLFNFRNVLQVYSATGSTKNPAEFSQILAAEQRLLQTEAVANSAYDAATGDVSLPADCSGWTTAGTALGVVNCFSLVRAEERFGNGDGVFSNAEQSRAIRARYDLFWGGQSLFLGLPRRVRLGLELNF